MATVVRNQRGKALHFKLAGDLTENVDLGELLGPVSEECSELVVELKDVTRVNSAIVRPWIEYFGARPPATRLRFVAVSSRLVHYFSLLRAFACDGSIESVVAPFRCAPCARLWEVTIPTSDTREVFRMIAAQTCPHCQRAMEFDDIPEEFFKFMVN